MAFTMEADNAFEVASAEGPGRPFRISLAMWANGLRVIDERGVTVADARSRARAACNLGGLERWGWITVGPAAPRARPGYGSGRGIEADTELRPTAAGSAARRLWPAVVGRVERAWAERFGADALDALRATLDLEPEMPWAPPEVHASHGFVSRLVEGPPEPGGPLVARLGQALTSCTLAGERSLGVSLPLAANFLRVIGTATVPLKELPAASGVSKEAVAMAVGFLARHRLATLVPVRSIRLTESGHEALERYRSSGPRPESHGLRTALLGVLGQTDALASGLVPPEGCWRAERPYRAHTDRVLADPLGALPRHPMVLHRGGWPDGS
jgi:hypothetical protein